MNSIDFQSYTANLLLHSAALSVAAILIALVFKNPHARSFAVLLGLLSMILIPWISALNVPVSKVPTAPASEVFLETAAPVVVSGKLESVALPVVEPVAEVPDTSKFTLPDPWKLLAGLWLVGTAVFSIRRILSAILLARWKSSLRKANSAELLLLKNNPDLPAQAKRILISPTGTSPCVSGILNPSLVLPANLLTVGNQRELQWALRHEAGHLRSHDLLWFAIFQIILAPLWWNPAAHRLIRIWSDAREKICDNLAVRVCEDRAEYAAFLVALCARRSHHAVLAMSGKTRLSRLKSRLCFLIEERSCRPCGHSIRIAVTVLMVLVGMGVSQVGLRAETSVENNGSNEPGISEKEELTAAADPLVKKPAIQPAAQPVDPLARVNQIKFTTKFLTTSAAFVENGKVIGDGELQLMMRELSQQRGVGLITAPSLTARSEQPSLIEIVGEDPANQRTEIPAAFEESTSDFVGIRIDFLGKMEGGEISYRVKIDFRHSSGTELSKIGSPGATPIDWKKVKKISVDVNRTVKPGDSICMVLGEIDPDHILTAIVTASAIDEEGHVLDANGNPIPDPEPMPREDAGEPVSIAPATPPSPLAPFKLFASGKVVILDRTMAGEVLLGRSGSRPGMINTISGRLEEIVGTLPDESVLELPSKEIENSAELKDLWKNFPRFRLKFAHEKSAPLMSVWWEHRSPGEDAVPFIGSFALKGSNSMNFELPSTDPSKRILLLLDLEVVPE